MQRNNRSVWINKTVGWLLAAAWVLAACGPKATAVPATSVPATSVPPTAAPTQGPQYADTIVIASDQDPTALDPAVVYDGSDRVTRLMYESLLGYKGSSTTELEPVLATDYSVSSDGLVYTFNLRHDVTFHDGTPFNAQAVKFSFDRAKKIGKGFAWAYWMIDEVKVVDDDTVEFHLNTAFKPFPYVVANRYASPIVSPSVMSHEVNGDLAEAWLAENAIGTGPYQLVKWTRQQEVDLEAYPKYWRPWTEKNIKHVIYKIVPESSTMRQMLERGEIDTATYPSVEDTIALQKNPDVNVVVAPKGASNFNWFVLFNTRKGLLQDAKVREALAWAFPYDDMVQVAFVGQATQSVGPVPIGTPGHATDLVVYHQDLDKAKQLLAEAGVQAGQTLKITYGNHDWGNKILDSLTTTLSELGFKVESEALGWTAMFENMKTQDTAPDIVISDWWDDYPDGVGYLTGVGDWFWWGSGREEKDYFYFNPEVKDLLDKATSEQDDAKRGDLLHQAQQKIVADNPAIWAFDYYAALPFRKNVKGYVYNPYYIYTYNLFDMWIEK
jgi:peptide/nickel transport system substrate-binding protein